MAFRPLPRDLPAVLLRPMAALALAAGALLVVVGVQVGALRSIQREPVLAPSPASPPAAHPNTAPSLAQLGSSLLFGAYDPTHPTTPGGEDKNKRKPAASELDANAAPPATLPEAALSLRLQGILFKPDPAERRAIIAGDGPRVESHKVGDPLAKGVRIRFIEARRVVVEQAGELKALTLVEPALTGAATRGPDPAPVARALESLGGMSRPGAIAPPVPPPIPPVPQSLPEPAAEAPPPDDAASDQSDAGAEQNDAGNGQDSANDGGDPNATSGDQNDAGDTPPDDAAGSQ